MRRMCRTLVEISPKCILRYKLATSTLEDLAEGHFHTVIGDEQLDPKQVKRVILCSGKVYYHLLEERMAREIDKDRKSTRLNSSHVAISYAVFCLKKKTITRQVMSTV